MRNLIQLICYLLYSFLLYGLLPQAYGQQVAFKDHPQQDNRTSQKKLRTVLEELESQYHVNFTYRSEVIEKKIVDQRLDQNQVTLDKKLDVLLRPFNLEYRKVEENYYLIYPAAKLQDQLNIEKIERQSDVKSSTSRSGILNNYQAIPYRLDNVLTNTQNQTITGKVTDGENDEPLPGVNVLAKGTTTGTVTGIDGSYRLTVGDEVTTLVFSSIGYVSEEVQIDNQTLINVVLFPDIQSLSEVVVVGYGAVQKRDLTGSVAKVEGDALANIPSPRVDQLLQGRAPGVNVTSVNGAPGARASIRIRGGNSIQGDNEPLYVIDGFIAGTNFNLNNINVNDIESIDILKDASAISIYGTRGANGVILITTKDGSGATGDKPNISFNTYTGFQQLARKIDFLNGPERATYGSELAEFSGESNPFVDESLIADTDWQDVITRTAPIHNMDLSVRGASEKINYFISGNYLNQEGIIRKSGIKRYAVRANLDFNLTEKIRLGTRINVTHVKNDNNLVNLWNARRALTSFPVYQEDGSYWDEDYIQGGPFDNPEALLNMQTNYTFVNNMLGNFYLEVEPFEGVTIRSTIGPQLNWRKQNRFESGSIPSRAAAQRGGRAIVNSDFGSQILQENTITYQKEFNDDHRLNLLGGFTWQTSRNEGFLAQTDGLPNDGVSFDVLELGNPESFQMSSSFNDPYQIVSWIGRANYTLMDKFLFTLAGRVDGASRFAGARNQYAFFPSAAFAWRLDEEDFIQNLGVFDDLKLRMSYGKAGSQAINAFSTLALYNTSQVIFNDAPAIAVRRDRPANPDLRWETTTQFDIGLEAGFFDNRLTFELDYYYKKTEDLLLNREIPRQTGFSQRLENIGSLQNQGLELLINTVNVDKSNFGWATTLTLAGNRSKVLELGGIDEINIYNLEQGGPGAKLIVGEPIGVFTGLKYLGTWKTQEELDAFKYNGLRAVVGGPRFNDTNGDGLISFNDDFVIIGNPEPIVFGGINNTFRWKNFNLDILLQGTLGNDVYNEFSQRGFFGRSDQNMYGEVRNRWTEENPISDIPRAGGTISISDIPSNTVLVEDGSHLRLKNVQLSYNLPTANVAWLNNLRVYVGGTNLFLLSKFRGYDPEATRIGPDSGDTYSGVIRGIIRAEYPNARTLTFGLNANF